MIYDIYVAWKHKRYLLYLTIPGELWTNVYSPQTGNQWQTKVRILLKSILIANEFIGITYRTMDGSKAAASPKAHPSMGVDSKAWILELSAQLTSSSEGQEKASPQQSLLPYCICNSGIKSLVHLVSFKDFLGFLSCLLSGRKWAFL